MEELVSYGIISPRIEWKTRDILSVPTQESDEFRFQESCWKLFLDKATVEGTEIIRINLGESRGGQEFNDFTSRVFVLDKNRMPQFLQKQLCTDSRSLCDKCVWWMDVKDFQRKEEILSTDGVVSFVCILMCEPASEKKGKEKKSVETYLNSKGEKFIEAHLLDFRRLLDDNALSDVTLKCGDRTIPAHRAILAARSEVFRAMLRYDMAESRSGVIEVVDVDPPILYQLLQFLYSCKLPDASMDTTPQLYEAADQYGVESLKNVCSAYMKENLTEENACYILLLADAHGDHDLKDGVVAFIVQKNLFQKDDIWPKFCEDHPKLAMEVLSRTCKTLISCFV